METYGFPPTFPAEQEIESEEASSDPKLPADKAKGKKVCIYFSLSVFWHLLLLIWPLLNLLNKSKLCGCKIIIYNCINIVLTIIQYFLLLSYCWVLINFTLLILRIAYIKNTLNCCSNKICLMLVWGHKKLFY